MSTNSSSNMVGIAAMCAATFGYITNDMMIKLAGDALPMGQIIFMRGVFASALVLGWIAFTRRGSLQHLTSPIVVARTVMEVCATGFYLAALFSMPIANTTTIVQTLPLLVTVLAVIILKEIVGWRRWTAILIGFAGMLLVVRPGVEGFSISAVYAVIGVAFMAVRDIMARFVPPQASPTGITAITAIAAMLLGLVFLPFEDWQVPVARELTLIGGSAFFVLAGYFFMFVATRAADMSALAPFRYTILIWAFLYGWLFWGDVPSNLTMFGVALIVGSGLFVFYRERAAQQGA